MFFTTAQFLEQFPISLKVSWKRRIGGLSREMETVPDYLRVRDDNN